jgi:hypothetical protein
LSGYKTLLSIDQSYLLRVFSLSRLESICGGAGNEWRKIFSSLQQSENFGVVQLLLLVLSSIQQRAPQARQRAEK